VKGTGINGGLDKANPMCTNVYTMYRTEYDIEKVICKHL